MHLSTEQNIRLDAAGKAAGLHVGRESTDEAIVRTADALANFILNGTVPGNTDSSEDV